jgi:hypothetical protein
MKTASLKNSMVALVILFLSAITGCTSQTASSLTPPASDLLIPADFTTYTEESGLFSISYPQDWELALSQIEDLQQSIKDLVTSINSNIPIEKTSIIFMAGLPNEASYSPNVNITVESLPGNISTHSLLVNAEIRGIKMVVDDYHELSREKTTVSGKEATIIGWEGTFPQFGKGKVLQMFMLIGKVGWCVTCTPPDGEFSNWEKDFNSVVRSLRILK